MSKQLSSEQINKQMSGRKYVSNFSRIFVYSILGLSIIFLLLAILFLFIGLGKGSNIKVYKDKAEKYQNIINKAGTDNYHRVILKNVHTRSGKIESDDSSQQVSGKAIYGETYQGVMYYYLELSFYNNGEHVSGKTETIYPQAAMLGLSEIDLCYTYENSHWIIVNTGYRLSKDATYNNLVASRKTLLAVSCVFFSLIVIDYCVALIYYLKCKKGRKQAKAIMKYNKIKLTKPIYCKFCKNLLKYKFYECPKCGAPILEEEYDEDKAELLENLK